MRFRTLASASLAVILLGVAAAPASAAPGEPDWYLSALKIDAGAAEGFTGDGVTIAVFDGQINPAVPTLANANIDVREPSLCYDESGEPAPATSTELSETKPTDHGTNVTSMIVGSGEGYPGQTGLVGVAPGAKILYYSVYTSSDDGSLQCLDEKGGPNNDRFAIALTDAIDNGADIISVSLSVGLYEDEIAVLARALREGVVVLGSLSNTSELDMSMGMPGFANGAIGIQAANEAGGIQATDGVPNTNMDTDIVAPGVGFIAQGDPSTGRWEDQYAVDGTSLATPLAAGVLALAMEKYPTATGNQIIQSQIRNTGGAVGQEPVRDPEELYGYGLISLTNLMTIDPTQYEDVNPLIQKTADSNSVLLPSYNDIFSPTNEPTASATPVPDEADETDGVTAPDAPADVESGLSTGIIVAIAVGALVLLAALALLIVLLRRSRRKTRA